MSLKSCEQEKFKHLPITFSNQFLKKKIKGTSFGREIFTLVVHSQLLKKYRYLHISVIVQGPLGLVFARNIHVTLIHIRIHVHADKIYNL